VGEGVTTAATENAIKTGTLLVRCNALAAADEDMPEPTGGGGWVGPHATVGDAAIGIGEPCASSTWQGRPTLAVQRTRAVIGVQM
jgi:hypothetical protein